MAQKGFHFDMTGCIGCKVCQIACKDKNDLKVGVLYRSVSTFEGGKYPSPFRYHLSMSCNHCEHPKCVANCPTGALFKREDGIVDHDREKCIGCKYCTWSCPYGAPQYKEDEGKVGKCDMCKDLLAQGQNPACVDACVMRILHAGELEELKKEYKGTADLAKLPDSSITNPSVLINAKPVAKKGV